MGLDSLPDFDPDLLVPVRAAIELIEASTKIDIKLAPFKVDGQNVDKSIDFDLGLEAQSLAELAGKTFSFPSNPEDGYVEGSIYIWTVHNPIDLHSITFGRASETEIEASVDMTFVFEFEGCARNLRYSMILKLTVNGES